jgi:hypothetical protein
MGEELTRKKELAKLGKAQTLAMQRDEQHMVVPSSLPDNAVTTKNCDHYGLLSRAHHQARDPSQMPFHEEAIFPKLIDNALANIKNEDIRARIKSVMNENGTLRSNKEIVEQTGVSTSTAHNDRRLWVRTLAFTAKNMGLAERAFPLLDTAWSR